LKVESATTGAWCLTGHLDLHSLTQWRAEVEDSIPADQNAQIDLAGLQIEGSAVLSLLVFMVRRAQLEGADVHFSNPSSQLLEMADMAELSALLKLGALK